MKVLAAVAVEELLDFCLQCAVTVVVAVVDCNTLAVEVDNILMIR